MATFNPPPDEIADCVLTTFDRLPAKRKPRSRENAKEWVPLSGIVLSRNDHSLQCVALGTGMKCLPTHKVHQADGNILHDWHAEIIAIRAFNRFLMEECAHPHSSAYIRNRECRTAADYQPFEVKDDVKIHLYCSEAPCGDASMELSMQVQDDATPWEAHPSSTNDEQDDEASLLGRGYFSKLGIVRRKPSRSDAPTTLSKSCTDKLALKQCSSVLSSLTSILFHPRNVYLESLILPASQHVPKATTRAFGALGRMKLLKSDQSWPEGYALRPFRIETTTREFAYSRRSAQIDQRLIPSNLSAVWTPGWQETLVGGFVQGAKAGNSKGASKVSRRGMWKLLAEIVGADVDPQWRGATYGDLKNCEILKDRGTVKVDLRREVLQGWTKNNGDDDFEL